jgi:hypothetical protein
MVWKYTKPEYDSILFKSTYMAKIKGFLAEEFVPLLYDSDLRISNFDVQKLICEINYMTLDPITRDKNTYTEWLTLTKNNEPLANPSDYPSRMEMNTRLLQIYGALHTIEELYYHIEKVSVPPAMAYPTITPRLHIYIILLALSIILYTYYNLSKSTVIMSLVSIILVIINTVA